jgi:hypothetical protein
MGDKPPAQVVGLKTLKIKGQVTQAGEIASDQIRVAIIDLLLGMLKNDPDPRAPAVMAELERQRALLVERMEEKDGGR